MFSVFLPPLSLYPFVGTFAAAGFKAMWTAQLLHKPVSSSHLPPITTLIRIAPPPIKYFKAKNMTPHEIAVFIEERKWDYRCA